MMHKQFARPGRFLRIILLGGMVVFTAGIARAQSAQSINTPGQSGFSSSQAVMSSAGVQMAELVLPENPEPAGLGAAESRSSQNAKSGAKSGQMRAFLHRDWTFEAGGGFNAPVSNGTLAYGSNFTIGAGRRINDYLSGLVEYQYIDDKLPLNVLAEADAAGAGAHIWSFTMDPVLNLFPKRNDSLYVTGGGGFYRVLTSLSNPSNKYLPLHFSSNQGGVNVGCGYQHRASMFGDSHATIFAEARFVDVLTPQRVEGAINIPASTQMVPVNFGIRF